MKNQKFNLKDRIRSFKYAFSGIFEAIREEMNMKIHLVAAVSVIMAGLFFSVTSVEWIILLFCIGGVWAMELINSSIENLADSITKEPHENIRKAKDMAAGAVLVSSIIALIIGCMIFLPYIVDYFM